MKKSVKIAITGVSAVCVAMLIVNPAEYIASAFTGIKTWAVVVLPSLLPFFFITALLTAINATGFIARLFSAPAQKLFGVSGVCSYVFIMSVLSGYPVGAKIICDLKENGRITAEEATKMSTFCSTSGPLFIIGSVGVGMFKDKVCGFILFFSHVIAAIAVGLIFRFFGKTEPSLPNIKKAAAPSNILYDCVYSAVISVAIVGGFICVFNIFADMAQNAGILLPIEKAVLAATGNGDFASGFSLGLIECTRGCKTIAESGVSALGLSLAESLISFGGVSVIFQSLAFLSRADVKTGVFLSAKAVQMTISAFICYLLCLCFGV